MGLSAWLMIDFIKRKPRKKEVHRLTPMKTIGVLDVLDLSAMVNFP